MGLSMLVSCALVCTNAARELRPFQPKSNTDILAIEHRRTRAVRRALMAIRQARLYMVAVGLQCCRRSHDDRHGCCSADVTGTRQELTVHIPRGVWEAAHTSSQEIAMTGSLLPSLSQGSDNTTQQEKARNAREAGKTNQTTQPRC